LGELEKEVMKTVFDYNDIHKGETIYVIGSAPSLLNLTEEDLEFIKDKPSIGVNLTYEGIKSIKYAISAHISPAVYLFEYANKDIPIFIHYGTPQKQAAFGYLQQIWASDRVVIFNSQPAKTELTRKQNVHDNVLNGSSSVLLLATHLAYIMGAGKIVYIGFEEVGFGHYWNYNTIIEDRVFNNIKKLLASKKYFSNIGYYESMHSLINVHHNVHREFLGMLGDGPLSRSMFHLSDHEKKAPFRNDGYTPVQPLASYVQFLNSVGIKTETMTDVGGTVASGCVPISKLK